MCLLCGGSQMPNGDYCRLFHLNALQERKRLKQFYFISLISKTYVQVAWDEVQNINNEVLTQTVQKMFETPQNKTNQPNKTPQCLLTWPSDEYVWNYFPGKDPLTIPTRLFRDLSLQIEPCMVGATSSHPPEKKTKTNRKTGQGNELS